MSNFSKSLRKYLIENCALEIPKISKEDVSNDGTKKWILESEKFQLEAITYMRGRSFSNTIVIIDEAQNLTPHEAKTVVLSLIHI